MRRNKYNARKIYAADGVFDSAQEYRRWNELNLLEQAGEISGLRRQVRFTLIPTQRDLDAIGKRGGVRRGRVIYRSCTYIADFVYCDGGKTIVEDVKGVRTPEYIIKKKLMLWVHGIIVREV